MCTDVIILPVLVVKHNLHLPVVSAGRLKSEALQLS
jgi:hypothetical protein